MGIICLATVAFAQKNVTGTVVDSNGEPLIGANVVEKNSQNGVITDVDGTFSLNVAGSASVLQISYIGYVMQDVKVGNQSVLRIILIDDSKELGEVVVTGYGGTRSRAKLTNSISKVKNETFDVGVFSNPAQALSGAVSGLRVIQNAGNPTAVPSVILRGGTNLDGTGAPLIMVDGQLRSNLSDINPNDIESMEVLKDAGATAIYGARANNGVVLITTKTGKAGRTEINVSTKVGMNYLNNPYTMLSARDYLYWIRMGVKNAMEIYKNSEGNWVGYANASSLISSGAYGTGNLYFDPANPDVPLDGNKDSRAIWSPMILNDSNRFLLSQGWQSMTDPVYGDEIIFIGFDYAKAAFRNPAITQDYNISLSGGNDLGHYYAGLGYYDAESLPIELFYRRISAVFNSDFKINRWLTSFSSANFSKNKYKEVPLSSYANYFGRMLSAPPTMRGTNAVGELLLGQSAADGNPRVTADAFQRDYNTDKLTLGQSFKFDIAKGLSLKANALWMFEKNVNESFNKDYQNGANVYVRTRSSSATYNETYRQTYNLIANYDFSIARHNIGILFGTEYYDEYYKAFSASGSGAPTDDFADLALTSTAENQRSIDSSHSRYRILSFLGRLNYDYMDKYLFSATFRKDGYSILRDNRWGFFPGVSAGWIFSKESFMEGLTDIVSFAKLKASYGVNGNVSGVGTYELQGAYGIINFDGNVGYALTTIPNPGLRWERSNTFETGVDISFLENRINTNIIWYNRTTVDKFANIPLPGSSGVTSIRSNNGSLLNNGIELELGLRIIQTSDWKWNFDANIAYNKSKVLKLPDNGLELNRQNAFQVYSGNGNELIWVGGYQEGQSPGALYAYYAEGIFKSDEEVAAIAGNRIDRTINPYGSGRVLYGPNEWDKLTDAQKAAAHPIQAGDVNWKDVNGDNVIDVYDKVYMGSTIPKFIGGLTNVISWRGISFLARLDYALGHYQHDTILPWFIGCQQGAYNGIAEVLDTWTPENPNAKYPKYYWADQNGKRNYARANNSLFVYNASYLAFREISLSYDINKDLLKKIGSSGIQLSITGQNLGYLTATKAYNPEMGGDNTSGFSLPRTFIFGASLKF
ncbi:MAG: TonB-dependent receptor [Tannerella sp.]|nr:TonB-dependent receptor [Tannerella sp.]